MSAALQAPGMQCSRQHGGFVSQFAPRHRAPDTALFLAQRRTLAALLGMVKEQLWKGVRFGFLDSHRSGVPDAL